MVCLGYLQPFGHEKKIPFLSWRIPLQGRQKSVYDVIPPSRDPKWKFLYRTISASRISFQRYMVCWGNSQPFGHKKNRVYVIGKFPVDANVIENCLETWPTSKIFISSASQNKFGRSMIIRWVIYRSVLCQKIGIFFSKITNMGCPFPQKMRKSSKNGLWRHTPVTWPKMKFFLSHHIRLPNIFPTIYGLFGLFAAVRPQ